MCSSRPPREWNPRSLSEFRGRCNRKYPSEAHFKLKSRENSSANIFFFNYPIVLNFYTAVLCAKFQNDWTTQTDVMGEQILGDLSLRWILYGYPILHSPPVHSKTPRQEFYRVICRGLCKICSVHRFRIWLKQNELNWDRKNPQRNGPQLCVCDYR